MENLPTLTKIQSKDPQDPTITVGQVWVKKRSGEEIAIKITSIDKGEYTKINYAYWMGTKWEAAKGKYSTGEKYTPTKSPDELWDYWQLFDGDFERVFDFAKAVIEGKEPMPVPADSGQDADETTALMGAASKEVFIAAQQQLEKQKQSVELVKAAMNVEIARRMRELEAMKDQMNGIMEVMNKKLAKIHRIIDTIELYLGVYEDIVQIQEGATAGPDEPISFRQMMLFLDEEIALYKFDADFEDIETFDNWLIKDGNYKIFAPEERCVVAFKPRRHQKDYYPNNPFENYMRNRPNFHSYLLIRNGENIYRIWSDLHLGDRLFPTRDELVKLGEKMDRWDKEKAEQAMHGYQRIAFVLQGLIDRTQIFQPIPPGIKIFELDKWEHIVRFIYDDEATLPSGRLPFREWQAQMRNSIDEGSRVVVAGTGHRKYDNRFYRYYSEYNMPNEPPTGLYQVYKFKETLSRYQTVHSKDHNSLCIRYNPGGEVRSGWGDWEGHERKNNISFRIDTSSDNLLNYDQCSLEDIEFYLYNRTDRRNYHSMLPILLKVKELILADKAWEANFVELTSREFGGKHKDIIWDCVKWWKDEKVKWKRAITKDDAKALRMIRSEVKRRISNAKIINP